MKKTIHLWSYPPQGWTPAQWASAERVTERFDQLPVNPDHWTIFGEYIGRKFGSMFIGIERDGYAHS
jgi:hypothetical protein